MNNQSALTHLSPKTLYQVVSSIFSTALPIVVIRVAESASGFISGLLLSRLGKEALAANTLISATQVTIIFSGSSLLIAVGVMTGQTYGASFGSVDPDRTRRSIGSIVQQGWAAATLLSIPSVLAMWYVGPVMRLLGQDIELVAIVERYLRPCVMGIPATFYLVCDRQFSFGVRNQWLPLVVSLLGLGVFSLTGYGFAFGKFGFPELGVAGIGYANAIQAWFSLLIMRAALSGLTEFKPYALLSWHAEEKWQRFKQLVSIGWPITLHTIGEISGLFVMAMMAGRLGRVALSAQQIATQYSVICFMPIIGLTQAVSIFIAQLNGSKNYIDLRKYGWAGILMGVGYESIILVIFSTLTRLLASAFLDVESSDNAPIVALFNWLLPIAAGSQWMDAIRNISLGNLRGLYDTKFPSFFSIANVWLLGMPLCWFLGFKFDLGAIGLAAGYGASLAVGALGLTYRWWQKGASLNASTSVHEAEQPSFFSRASNWCSSFFHSDSSVHHSGSSGIEAIDEERASILYRPR